jgi:ketosteroid isomerase-like protein
MARSAQEAFETHLESLGTGDLDKIAADYSDDCIQISNRQTRRGKAGVKEAFAQIFSELAAAGEIKGLEVPVRVYEDNVLYIEWWADLGDMRCDGVDTFIFEGGQITVQTVKYDITKAV